MRGYMSAFFTYSVKPMLAVIAVSGAPVGIIFREPICPFPAAIAAKFGAGRRQPVSPSATAVVIAARVSG